MWLSSRNIIDLSEVYKEDKDLVGKKAFELGELKYLGIPIPEGFVIKTSFFEKFMVITGISEDLEKIKKTYHPSLKDSVEKLFDPIRKKIMNTHIPNNLTLELHRFYRKLAGRFKEASVNISTSSPTNKSIVFSNIKGDANVVLKIKTIWSSHFNDPVAIIVMNNIQSGTKGKIFTDYPIADKKLTELQKNKLVEYCKTIQKHFYFPKEIEYIVNNGEIFITKVNPFTGTVNEPPKQKSNNHTQKVFIKGISLNPGIVTGTVRILHNKYNAIKIKKGEIAVLPDVDHTLFERIRNAKAVVVDSILPNSLDKALFRKGFQIPTVIGAKNATKMFQNGNIITVNGVSGEICSGGLVY